MRTDHELQKKVLEQLDYDPAINASHVGVVAREGIVTLSGHVSSYSEKMKAEAAAGLVRGVKGVVDTLTVELPGHCDTPDETVVRRAYERLAHNSNVPPDRIHISVSEGVVTLRGDVDWEFQRAAAAYDLQHLRCVRGVRNEVTIRPPVEAAVASEGVHRALSRLGFENDDKIDVQARGSEIRLCGQVTSWSERRLAEEAAWSLPGVSHVDNRLTVNW
jgi:osmotically-inducible protein OsmY